MAARSKMRSLGFTLDDLDVLIAAIRHDLATGLKTGDDKRRTKLYALKRRCERAKIELER